MISIRPTEAQDIPALQEIVRLTGLFPPEMLADMVLHAQPDAQWLTAHRKAVPVGMSFCEPEALADRVGNLRALAVHPDHWRGGIARSLVAATEDTLRASGGRLLLVDTASGADQGAARALYAACGYRQEAVIRDYWYDGEDKITFRKAL